MPITRGVEPSLAISSPPGKEGPFAKFSRLHQKLRSRDDVQINGMGSYSGVATTSVAMTPPTTYHQGKPPGGYRPRGGLLSDLDSFDFSRASRSDMKRLVRTLFNTLTLMLFVYLTAFFAIFCGLFLLALRKAENLASAHHDCLSYMRPPHAYQ
jgi:hypothetical protein